MVSPGLVKKNQEVKPAQVNESAKRLFQVIYNDKNKKDSGANDDSPKISVSAMVSRVAFFYEKIRNAIDYDEDHLLRKNAIIRILKRQIVIESVIRTFDASEISTHLLQELIRGSYLPNDKIPESKIDAVAKLIEKYIKLKNLCVLKINSEADIKNDVTKVKNLISERNKTVNWILALAACEIEESLGSNKIKQTITANLFDFLKTNIKLDGKLNYEADLEIQIYLSICRNYIKFDEDMMSFVLFKYYNDSWVKADPSEEDTRKIAQGIRELQELIKGQLNHPLVKQVDKVVRKYALYSTVMAETIDNDPVKVYNDISTNEKTFLASVSKVCSAKYKKARKKLWRAAVRSIIYIFLTKSIFVFILEVPATRWFNEPLNPVALAINVIFPALLLFIIVALVRTPGASNTAHIINGIKELFFVGSERRQPIVLRGKTTRGLIINGIFNMIYASTFFFSTYFVIWALTKIGFNWVSIVLFLFFLAFVSFFSVITTRGVRELTVVERKENLFTFLLDLFYMPIIIMGKWLSGNFSKVNIFIFIFDFIIEAPFKVLVEVAEDWTRYVKERKDNMV